MILQPQFDIEFYKNYADRLLSTYSENKIYNDNRLKFAIIHHLISNTDDFKRTIDTDLKYTGIRSWISKFYNDPLHQYTHYEYCKLAINNIDHLPTCSCNKKHQII